MKSSLIASAWVPGVYRSVGLGIITLTMTGAVSDSLGSAVAPGNHAAISVGFPSGVTAWSSQAWGTSYGDSTYGTGANPTDYTAGDGGSLYWEGLGDDGNTYRAIAGIRYAAGTASAITDGQTWVVDDTSVNINAAASGANLTFSYALTGVPSEITINSSSGAITGTVTFATGGVTGSGTATITATDQYGRTYPDTFTWTYDLRAQATAANGLGPFSYTVDDDTISINFVADFTANGNTLGYSIAGLPAGGVDDGDGTASGTPTVDSQSGSIVCTATDEYGRETTSTATFTTAYRTQATSGAALDLSFPEGAAISSTDLAQNFTENGNTLTYLLVDTPPAGLSATGKTLTGTPTAVTADANYTFQGTDEYGRVTSVEHAIEVTAALQLTAADLQEQEASGNVPVALTGDNGTYPWILTTTDPDTTAPSRAQVVAGQDHTGSAAAASGSVTVTSGTPTNVSLPSGLSGIYYLAVADSDSVVFDGTGQAINTTPPEFSSAEATGANTVVVTLTKSVTGTGTAGDWAFTINGGAATITNAVVSGSTVTLTVSDTMTSADTLAALAYTKGANVIADAFSNELASFSGQAITNSVPSSALFNEDFTTDVTGEAYWYKESASLTLTANTAETKTFPTLGSLTGNVEVGNPDSLTFREWGIDVDVTESTTYDFTVAATYTRGATGTSMSVIIRWLNSGGTAVGGDNIRAYGVVATNKVNEVLADGVFRFTAPSGAAKARLEIGFSLLGPSATDNQKIWQYTVEAV